MVEALTGVKTEMSCRTCKWMGLIMMVWLVRSRVTGSSLRKDMKMRLRLVLMLLIALNMVRLLIGDMVNVSSRGLKTCRIFMSFSLVVQPYVRSWLLNVAINLILLIVNWAVTLALVQILPLTLKWPRGASLVLK